MHDTICRTVGMERTHVLTSPTGLAGGAGFEPASGVRAPALVFETSALSLTQPTPRLLSKATKWVVRWGLRSGWIGLGSLYSADRDGLPHGPANVSPDRDPCYGNSAYGGSIDTAPHHSPSDHRWVSFLGPLRLEASLPSNNPLRGLRTSSPFWQQKGSRSAGALTFVTAISMLSTRAQPKPSLSDGPLSDCSAGGHRYSVDAAILTANRIEVLEEIVFTPTPEAQ